MNNPRHRPAHVGDIDVRTPSPTCRRCGVPFPLTIDVVSGPDDYRLTMTSCPQCQHREWTDDAGSVAELDVMCLLSGNRSFTLAPSADSGRHQSRVRDAGS